MLPQLALAVWTLVTCPLGSHLPAQESPLRPLQVLVVADL